MEELEVKMLAAHRKGLTERLEPTEDEATTEGDRTITADRDEGTNNMMAAPTPHSSESCVECSMSICQSSFR